MNFDGPWGGPGVAENRRRLRGPEAAAGAAEAARILDARVVVPLHFEQWARFSQGRETLVDAFARAGLGDRLRLPGPGEEIEV
ncbi:hypothetical protein [Streptomyces litchfieldiae]|uniref:hypothetical protein n=1 Tax=Streptomyces litchfieldiae TaxID=3075543 RepID=UPI00374E142C